MDEGWSLDTQMAYRRIITFNPGLAITLSQAWERAGAHVSLEMTTTAEIDPHSLKTIHRYLPGLPAN